MKNGHCLAEKLARPRRRCANVGGPHHHLVGWPHRGHALRRWRACSWARRV